VEDLNETSDKLLVSSIPDITRHIFFEAPTCPKQHGESETVLLQQAVKTAGCKRQLDPQAYAVDARSSRCINRRTDSFFSVYAYGVPTGSNGNRRIRVD